MQTSDIVSRLGIFFVVLTVMLVWESLLPFRRYPQSRLHRFAINFGMMGLNSLASRLLAGAGAVGLAAFCSAQGWGLLNRLDWPQWVESGLALLAFDFAIYWQHRWFHRVPLFWRLHRVHHTDIGFDTSTAVRFHAAEIVLSMYYKMLLVTAIGPTPETVLAFEAVLNACALFNHGNVRLPKPIEHLLRYLLITPDLHRIHHSADDAETHTNFGFCVPWWDRLCGSFKAAPAMGQDGMVIGLPEPREPRDLSFVRLLTLPFRR